MSIKISVIIPVYNKGEFVDRSIRSVLSQTYDNFEIIAIDDFSNDDSYSDMIKIASDLKDKRLNILKNATNKGVSYTRNRGIDSATGDYVVFLDADDEICDHRLFENAIKIIKEFGANYILLTRNYYSKYSRPQFGSISKYMSKVREDVYLINDNLNTAIHGNFPFGGSASAILSKELISETRFRIAEKRFEDWLFFTPLFLDSTVYYYRPETIKINYIENSLSRSMKKSEMIKMPTYYNYLKESEDGIKLQKTFFWLWLNSIIDINMKKNEIFKILKKYKVEIVMNFHVTKKSLRNMLIILYKIIKRT